MDQRFWYNLGGFIRGYQEGGAVAPTPLTPGVQTGVPQGGHAGPCYTILPSWWSSWYPRCPTVILSAWSFRSGPTGRVVAASRCY